MAYTPTTNIKTKWLIFSAIIGAALSLAGPVMLFMTITNSIKAFESRNWSKAVATITQSKIVELIAPKSTRYDVELAYRFSVDGKEYQGSRRAFGDRAVRSKADAQANLETYARDSLHAVWYDPTDPTQSVLERGLNIDNFLLPGVALLMTLAGPIILRDQLELINSRRRLNQSGD